MQRSINYTLLFIIIFGPFLLNGQSLTSAQISALLNTNRVKAGLTEQDVSEFQLHTQYTDAHNGITHIYLQQEYNGVPIRNAIMGLHLDESGELLTISSRFVGGVNNQLGNTTQNISALTALQSALSTLGIEGAVPTLLSSTAEGLTFEGGLLSAMDIPVKDIYQLDENGKLQRTWLVGIYTMDKSHYWEMAVDAGTGLLLDQKDLVVSCTFHRDTHKGGGCTDHTHAPSLPLTKKAGFDAATLTNSGQENFYRVFDYPVESPSHGERTLVKTAGDPVASPLGWHNDGITDYAFTRGNNTYTYLDPSPASAGIPTFGGLPVIQSGPLLFDFDLDLSLHPTLYKDAAVTNLFYWNNLIHDVFYHYGFTEPAGNFQWHNLNRGGQGLDAVLAEAQDGSGVDNANFLTLADGLPGRMQMFLWTTNVPLIDGDFDNGVIAHEYGHGISTRLTGGPNATCLSGDEQGGEGWSDFFGLLLTMNPDELQAQRTNGRGIGTFVLAEDTNGDGIRPAKYSTDMAVNSYTYGDITNPEISVPHGVGFIWCTMLNEMTWLLIDKYGYDEDIAKGTGGNNIALQLVVDGLKLQPCSPTFVEMRDAILLADQINNNGANQCLIWEAFAKRGLGYSAQSGTNTLGDETEAFDLPPAYCMPVIQLESSAPGVALDGETIELQLKLVNNSTEGISGINLTNELPSGLDFLGASHQVVNNGNTLEFKNLSVGPNSVLPITITARIAANSTANLIFRDDLEENPFNWETTIGLNNFTWSNTEAFSGNYAWFAADPDNLSNQTLQLKEPVQVVEGMHLRFAHRYNTEKTFDGGLVEFSNDGGTTWNDAGPLFVSNGYNDLIAVTDNPLIRGFAFGGQSDGFIHSIADLSPLAGEEIMLRFRFASDVATGQDGWYIDDIELVTDPLLQMNRASFSMAAGAITRTVSDEILIVANATSINELTGGPLNGLQAGTELYSDFSFEAVPNPATDQARLYFTGQLEGELSVRLMRADGQLVWQSVQSAEEGNSSLEVNLTGLPSGLYVLQAENARQVRTQKLIIGR